MDAKFPSLSDWVKLPLIKLLPIRQSIGLLPVCLRRLVAQSAHDEHVLARKFAPGDVLIATNLGGRGSDYKVGLPSGMPWHRRSRLSSLPCFPPRWTAVR